MGELDKAKPLTETAKNPYTSYLFYGPGGSGKSMTAMNHPGKSKVYLDFDQKLVELIPLLQKDQVESVKLHWTHGELLQGSGEIEEVIIDRERKNPQAGNLLKTQPMGYRKSLDVLNELLRLAKKCRDSGQPFPYDCVIGDSLSRLADHLYYSILFRHNVTIITETLYDVFARAMKEWLMGFISLPCDKILIAHSKRNEKRHKQTGAIIQDTTTPLLLGQTKDQLITYFTEAYLFLGRGEGGNIYNIQTAKDREADARTARKLEFEEPLKMGPDGRIDVSRIFSKR